MFVPAVKPAAFRCGQPGRPAGRTAARRACRRVRQPVRRPPKKPYRRGCAGYPADEFAPPGGGLLIGLLNDQPVTGGAFRRFDDGHRRAQAHLDRQPLSARRQAKALLVELEAGDRRPRLPERLSHDGRSPARGRGALPLDGIHPAGRAAARRGRGLSARVCKGALMTDHLHLAVALDGYGWHPGGMAAHARPRARDEWPVLVRPGRDRRTRVCSIS